MIPVPGLGAAGQMGAGTPNIDGSVRDLALSALSHGVVAATFANDHAAGDAFHRFIAYQDREPVAIIKPGQGFESEPLADGAHDFIIFQDRETALAIPSLHGDYQGRRAFVQWTRAAEADVRSYSVYWDSGTGTISYAAALATVSKVEIERRFFSFPDAGTGTGRLTVSGEYRGDACNATWAVKVTGAAKWQYSPGGAFDGTDKDLLQGVPYNLPGGVVVTFNSDPSLYVINDQWNFAVGPRNHYVSAELANGNYKFAVKATDAAGNQSDASGEIVIAVNGEPDPPSGVVASYAPATKKLTVNWTDSTGGASYSLYLDYDLVFDRAFDHIEENGPAGTVGSGVEVITVTFASHPGTIRGYLRAMNSAGVEERNCNLIELDCFAAADMPASLATPAVQSVSAIAGGKLRASFSIDRVGGDPTNLKIYTSADGTWASASLAATVAFVAAGYPVSLHTWDSGVLGAETWIGVRAADASGLLSAQSNLESGTPDATAPAAPDGESGCPT